MLRLSTLFVSLSLMAGPSGAQGGADALFEALRLDEVVAVMREEGLDYGRDLEAELFPGGGGAAWRTVVGEIYAVGEMEDDIARAFAANLDPEEIAPLLSFFGSDRGAEIVDLEIEARLALQDEDVEDAATARAQRMREAGDDRIGQLDRFVEANDLVEENVVGALNSNYAFYQGLMSGGAIGGEVSEDQILSDVWSQEPEIRADTTGWVYGFLTLAYGPLSDDDLDVYIAFSRTPEGQALNDALFAAFDGVYAGISRRLGLEAASFMAGEDI